VAAAPPVRCVSEDHLNSTPRGRASPLIKAVSRWKMPTSTTRASCCYLSVPHWLGPWPYKQRIAPPKQDALSTSSVSSP
jgi:hypothetical protein